ncbi:hypothetical protein AALA98_08005 [Lachnospiraceae bacterium 45-W7]
MQVDNVKSTERTAQPAKAQINPTAGQPDNVQDSVSKELQSKILDAQKQRQGLSFNMEMTAEEKENIRQKIQQEISDLKRELRQREAEEKKKQQETEKAIARKEEQQEKAAQETARKQQQKVQPAQEEKEQQQSISVADNGKPAENAGTDGEVREILPGGMHKIISTHSSIQQFRIVKNVIAQNDSASRIQETELHQDAARTADTNNLKKETRESVQKETQRMETVQKFIFGNQNNKAAESTSATGNRFSGNAKENGLYDNTGVLFPKYFPSIQMDVRS